MSCGAGVQVGVLPVSGSAGATGVPVWGPGGQVRAGGHGGARGLPLTSCPYPRSPFGCVRGLQGGGSLMFWGSTGVPPAGKLWSNIINRFDPPLQTL